MKSTLIRYDIVVVLRRLYDETRDTDARVAAESLIATETDEKYRKKYSSAWRGHPSAEHMTSASSGAPRGRLTWRRLSAAWARIVRHTVTRDQVKREQVQSHAVGAPTTGSTPAGREVVKVACVGDSITRGTFVWHRRKNSYPTQLQVMLGERFCVRNFGANGHAAQAKADRPYRNSRAFALSSTFEPDVVLIMLGTNDSRGDNWRGVGPFSADYRGLVAHYLSLESNPKVCLLTPPALFRLPRSTRVRYGMDELAVQEMCGAIKSLAHELGCDVVDIHEATAHHPEAFRFDGVHPGAAGATLIARAAHQALTEGVACPREPDASAV